MTTQVVGFKKLRWFTYENLGEETLDMPPSELQTTGYWLSLSEETLSRLRDAGNWSNDRNNYGADWTRIRDRVRARDKYQCQVCGAPETDRQHDVHHKIPFRSFTSALKKPIVWKISPHSAEPAIKKWNKTSASAADLPVSASCLATSRRSS